MNDPGVVQLLAPVTKNPNAKGLRGVTPIQRYVLKQVIVF